MESAWNQADAQKIMQLYLKNKQCTTTITLIDPLGVCIKNMMMPMELRDNNLGPGGNGNWDDIKKKTSSNSDEICESDIDKREKIYFQNSEITILPFWYPKFMENGLKSAFLVGFG